MHLRLNKTAYAVLRALAEARFTSVAFDEDDTVVSRAAVDKWMLDKPDLTGVAAEDLDAMCRKALDWLEMLKTRAISSLSPSQQAMATGFICGELIKFHTELGKLLVEAGYVEQRGDG